MPGQGPKRAVSLESAIDDETLGVPVACQGYPYVTAWIKGTGTTSSGVITLEEAEWGPTEVPYSVAGGWSSITTVNASEVTGGLQKAVHFAVGNFAYVRARVSTVIGGGGSITVVFTLTGAS